MSGRPTSRAEEQPQRHQADPSPDRAGKRPRSGLRLRLRPRRSRRPEHQPANERPADDDRELRERRRPHQRDRHAGHGKCPSRPIGCQRASQQIHGLRHDRDRGELQAVQPAGRRQVGRPARQSERHQRDRRGQREPDPRHDAAEDARLARPDRDPELTAGRSGQRLAEGDQIGEAPVVEPAAAVYVLAAEVADVGDRATEGGQAQSERGAEHLGETRRRRSWAAHLATLHRRVRRRRITTPIPNATAIHFRSGRWSGFGVRFRKGGRDGSGLERRAKSDELAIRGTGGRERVSVIGRSSRWPTVEPSRNRRSRRLRCRR